MIEQFLAIVRNTFYESIRQPILLVILVIATIGLILANPLSAFTMEDDQRMLIDLGLATIFLCGTLIAAFVATNVLSREIENKTALTIISKPVGRPLFVLGKYFGVAGAILISTLYMAFVFLLVEEHAVLQTVRDPVHLPVVTFGVLAGVIGLGVGIWCNYFYNKVFASTVIVITTPLAALAYVFSMMFSADFSLQPMSDSFRPHLWLAIVCIIMALLVLTAIALAASTRLGQLMTLVVTLGLFVLGMMSDWLFGRRIEALRQTWLERATSQGLTETVTYERSVDLISGEPTRAVELTRVVSEVPLYKLAEGWEMVQYALWWVAYAVVPNFQVMLLSDALTQGHVIPVPYVLNAMLYGVFYIVVALALAVILFQRREVG